MPILITYDGRPVKRRRRLPTGELSLTFKSVTPGDRGEKLLVTQADWLKYGREEYFEPEDMPDVRKLAAAHIRPSFSLARWRARTWQCLRSLFHF